jgi:SAM-dependent methyltransferase
MSSRGRLARPSLEISPELADRSPADLAAALLAGLDRPLEFPNYVDKLRFLTLLNLLAERLDEVREAPENRASLTLLANHFAYVASCAARFGVPLTDTVHLEIGCGSASPYARMFTHLMAGARRAICVDLDAPQDEPSALRALARIAAQTLIDPQRLFGAHEVERARVLDNLRGFDLARLGAGERAGLAADRIELRLESAAALGIPPNSVDLVVSNSVLEHLPDVDAAIAELARVTRPGGYGIHLVDVVDHRVYQDPTLHPLEFLTIADAHGIVHDGNRLRLHEVGEAFLRHGFVILDTFFGNPIDVAAIRSRLVDPWRRMPDEALDHGFGLCLVRRAS